MIYVYPFGYNLTFYSLAVAAICLGMGKKTPFLPFEKTQAQNRQYDTAP